MQATPICEIAGSVGFLEFFRLRANVACILDLKGVYHPNMSRGGARPRSGPKTELNGQPVRRVQLTLDDRTVKLLKVLGDGNASKGARISAEIAYERYLKSP
jgi:hypothetical protein